MRNLKITNTKKTTSEDESFEEFIPQFDSDIDRYESAMNQFERRTGLKDGVHVRYIGVSDEQICHWGGRYTDPRDILNSDTIYEIEYILIARSYSIVKLIGFRHEKFNGVIFEAVDKTEPRKSLELGDSVRYIGSNAKDIKGDSTNNLIKDAIYVVESIEIHPCYFGHKVIKLVGFEECQFDRTLFEKVTINQ